MDRRIFSNFFHERLRPADLCQTLIFVYSLNRCYAAEISTVTRDTRSHPTAQTIRSRAVAGGQLDSKDAFLHIIMSFLRSVKIRKSNQHEVRIGLKSRCFRNMRSCNGRFREKTESFGPDRQVLALYIISSMMHSDNA